MKVKILSFVAVLLIAWGAGLNQVVAQQWPAAGQSPGSAGVANPPQFGQAPFPQAQYPPQFPAPQQFQGQGTQNP
jgi:hypothetical protein